MSVASMALPDRAYGPDAAVRKRLLPFGIEHPAKLNLHLLGDLLRRYTRPGHLLLDPFGGVGSLLMACLPPTPRHVLLVELEKKYCQAAGANAGHIAATLPGLARGQATVLQGDSRCLPLPTASADCALTSPPYERQITQGGETGAWRAKYGYQQANAGYSRARDNIGNAGAADYATAVRTAYAECFRVVRPGGLLVLVVGDYVRDGQVIALGEASVALAGAVGWTPLERWRHAKGQLSFWRLLHARHGQPVIAHEHILVFCKGPRPAWPLLALPPATRAAAVLPASGGLGLGAAPGLGAAA